MNKTRPTLWNYLKTTLLFLILVVISLVIFFIYVQADIEKNTKANISSNVSHQRSSLLDTLDIQYCYLEGLADYVAGQDELFSDENLTMIKSVTEKSTLEQIALIDADGNCRYSNGSESDVSERGYFQKAMQNSRALSTPLTSKLDGSTRVILSVPIVKDQEVIGVLGGSYDIGALSQMLVTNIYDGFGIMAITGSDGEILLHGRTQSDYILDVGDNIFSFYDESKISPGLSLESFQTDFANAADGLIELTLNGKSYYACYMPANLNDWMLCYIVPCENARADYSFIITYERRIIAVIVAEFALFLFLLYHINRHERRRLLQYAQTDALTGALNKLSTEHHIGQWLEEAGSSGLPQAFMMMDLDHFKDVNDQYGHAAGDTLLHAIGDLLQVEFRDNDIIGRLGGDEFCILMKNARPEAAEHKAAALCAAIRELKIPDAEGLSVTCSIGISVSPQHGHSFMELYQCADSALYQTKRRGRNGYTLYSPGLS